MNEERNFAVETTKKKEKKRKCKNLRDVNLVKKKRKKVNIIYNFVMHLPQ